MQERASSLDFFTEASGCLWQNLLPADGADGWIKNFIWVLGATSTPSGGFPSKPENMQASTSTKSATTLEDFVRDEVVGTRWADIDTRGSSERQSVDTLTKDQLLDICKNEGTRPVSLYRHVDALC